MADTEVSLAPPGPEGAPPRRRLTLIWIGVAVALFAGAVVLILVLTGGDDSPPAATGPDRNVAGLSPQVAELVNLLEQGENETFHARYRAISASTPQAETAFIDVWRDPPRLRQDVTISVGGQVATSAAFVLPDRALGCTREREGAAWTCTAIPEQQAVAPDSLARQIAGEIEGGTVTVSSRQVAGLQVQCYELPVSGSTSEVCVTEEGIPALVSSGPSRIELVELGREVAGDVFTPPVGGA